MEQVSASSATVETFPSMNWGAVVAGWMMALGIGVILYLGGLALGLASLHAHAGADTARTIGIGATIWILLTWMGALFVGGLFASWFDGKNDTMMGAMHGLSVWGLSITMTIVLLVFAGQLMHRAGSGNSMRAPMMTEHGMMERGDRVGLDMAILHAQLARAARRDDNDTDGTKDAATPSTGAQAVEEGLPLRDRAPRSRIDAGLHSVEMALVHGDKDGARALLAAQSGLSDEDAGHALQAVASQVDKTREDAKQAAMEAAHHAASMAAIALLGALCSMLTALLGGWMGANHVHKVYHLRTYTRVNQLPLP